MDFLFDLSGPIVYVVVFAFAYAEGGLLVGLFLPGEAPILLGGVLAAQGRVSLPGVLAVTIVGAVAGDSTGYWLGRRYGSHLEETRLGMKVGQERWEKARGYLRARGGRAVFLGRFVSIFRTLVPPVAGLSHLPYRRFVAYNVPAAVLFSVALVVAGYVAGSSWQLVERWLGRGAAVLLVIIVVVGLIAWGARSVARSYPAMRSRVDDFLERPRIKRLRVRYEREIAFLRRRFEPGPTTGLFLTAGAALVILLALGLGSLIDEVLEGETLEVDRPVVLWLQEHREPVLNDLMKIVTVPGGGIVTSVVFALAAVIAFARTHRLRLPAFLAFCLVGAVGLAPLIKQLIGRPRPDFTPLVEVGGYAFPSGHATAAAVTFGALAYALTRSQSWRAAVWIWAVAGMIAFLIGFSRIYLGVHWPTDVFGGWALGLLWVAVGALVTDLAWEREGPRSRRRYPAADLPN